MAQDCTAHGSGGQGMINFRWCGLRWNVPQENRLPETAGGWEKRQGCSVLCTAVKQAALGQARSLQLNLPQWCGHEQQDKNHHYQ